MPLSLPSPLFLFPKAYLHGYSAGQAQILITLIESNTFISRQSRRWYR